MTDLPPWYTIATVGLGAAVGAALAAMWHGLWPYGDPNLLLFMALAALVALVGVRDTFRSLTRTPLEPGMALVQLVVAGVAMALMTRHVLPFFIGMLLLAGVRGQAGALTRRVVDLYDIGTAEIARQTRRHFTTLVLITEMVLAVSLVLSGLDHSAGLLSWTTAPVVLLGGVCGLMLISGAEYEVMRSRFQGGEVTTDAGFGAGWWGPVAGLIAAAVIIAALLPPLPAYITLGQVGHAVVHVSQHTIRSSGPQNLHTPHPHHTPAVIKKIIPKRVRDNFGTYLFLFMLVLFVLVLAVRSVRYARRLGLDVTQLARQYLAVVLEVGRSSLAFILGFYEILMQGVRDGDWRGMTRFLRRWWNWLLDVITRFGRGNVWRQLGIRSAGHKEGAEFAAATGARTGAGSAWNLAPGDPRRRIRELYRELIGEAARAGLPRRPHQTPETFRRSLVATEPDAAPGLELLTDAYEWARFSPHPVTGEHVAQASSGWQRISGFFTRRQQQQPTKAAGPVDQRRARSDRDEGRGVRVDGRGRRHT